jgi:hypothetical protein
MLVLILFINFYGSNNFEIEIIADGPIEGRKNIPMELPGILEGVVEQMAKDLNSEARGIDFDDDFIKTKKKRRSKPFPRNLHKPHRHRNVVETHGPGFATVEITEFITNDDKNNIKHNLSMNNNELGNGMKIENLNKMMNDMLIPMPLVFVKTSNTRKNLQNYNSDRQNPHKIFAEMEKAFDSFFKIDSKNSSSFKVNDVKDITNEKNHVDKINHSHSDPEVEKLIKILPYAGAGADSVAGITARDVRSEHTPPPLTEVHSNLDNIEIKKDIKLSENKENDLKTNQSLNHPNIISDFSYSNLKYIIYVALAVLTFLFVKFVISKITESEQENIKANSKHSINEIEDELKQMKDKNKLY